MKRILVYVAKLFVGLVALISTLLLASWAWDKYKFYSWRPPTAIDGISIGMSKSDVLFLKGAPTDCPSLPDSERGPDTETCYWGATDNPPVLVVFFKNESVDVVAKDGPWIYLSTPIRSVEDMQRVLGHADVMSASGNSLGRQYTYDKYRFGFFFERNQLNGISLGTHRWAALNGTSEYVVGGKTICPSPACPFDSVTGKTKPEYASGSYRDFLP